jgi:hypothetical protein
LLDHLNSDGFDCRSDWPFRPPRSFFHWRVFGLGLATVRFIAFAAFDTLRALLRLAELRSFADFCTFDAFLRLAMIAPLGAAQRYNPLSRGTSYQQISA